LGILEIPFKDSRSSNANLSSWVRGRVTGIVHLLKVLKLILKADSWPSNMPSLIVKDLGSKRSAASFSLPICLHDWAAEYAS